MSATSGPSDQARHRALAHPSRARLLERLEQAADGLGAADLAAATGLHANTVRVHLDQLVAAGLVTTSQLHGRGRARPPTWYRAATARSEAADYRLLSAMLASALQSDRTGPSPAAEAAGRRWGRELLAAAPTAADDPDPAGPITALFERLGFAPRDEDDHLALVACPYRELAREHPDVICGLHLGILRGAAEASDVPADQAWLQPFVTPTRCHAGVGTPPSTP
jgi:predicted ArsR family transcriptional regulator